MVRQIYRYIDLKRYSIDYVIHRICHVVNFIFYCTIHAHKLNKIVLLYTDYIMFMYNFFKVFMNFVILFDILIYISIFWYNLFWSKFFKEKKSVSNKEFSSQAFFIRYYVEKESFPSYLGWWVKNWDERPANDVSQPPDLPGWRRCPYGRGLEPSFFSGTSSFPHPDPRLLHSTFCGNGILSSPVLNHHFTFYLNLESFVEIFATKTHPQDQDGKRLPFCVHKTTLDRTVGSKNHLCQKYEHTVLFLKALAKNISTKFLRISSCFLWQS